MDSTKMPAAALARPEDSWLSRAAAVLEVVGSLMGGIAMGRFVRSLLGIESWKAVQAVMVESGNPDFWRLAWLATVEQVFKYGFAFVIFYGIGRWHRGRRLPAYGVRTGGRSIGSLVAIGVVGWAALGVLPYALQVLATAFPVLGQGPDHWSLFPSTWSLGFLVYMAASSFALVPIVEELYARGYMVTRLGEDYGPAGGVLLSALFFALAHGQYFKAEVLSLGMLVSLILGSIISGYIFLRSGSLVPVIVAHALINVPTPPAAWGQPVLLAIMVAVLIVARRPVFEWMSGCLGLLKEARWGWTAGGMLVLGGSLAAVALGMAWLPYLAAAMLGLSLAAHALEKRRRSAF